uniref:Uncharacterized protein n=1 Tax=Strigamia maritima TaxID=126957 RepID=T1JLG5_STRMM
MSSRVTYESCSHYFKSRSPAWIWAQVTGLYGKMNTCHCNGTEGDTFIVFEIFGFVAVLTVEVSTVSFHWLVNEGVLICDFRYVEQQVCGGQKHCDTHYAYLISIRNFEMHFAGAELSLVLVSWRVKVNGNERRENVTSDSSLKNKSLYSLVTHPCVGVTDPKSGSARRCPGPRKLDSGNVKTILKEGNVKTILKEENVKTLLKEENVKTQPLPALATENPIEN